MISLDLVDYSLLSTLIVFFGISYVIYLFTDILGDLIECLLYKLFRFYRKGDSIDKHN